MNHSINQPVRTSEQQRDYMLYAITAFACVTMLSLTVLLVFPFWLLSDIGGQIGYTLPPMSSAIASFSELVRPAAPFSLVALLSGLAAIVGWTRSASGARFASERETFLGMKPESVFPVLSIFLGVVVLMLAFGMLVPMWGMTMFPISG